jgi:hypothetical protein
VDNKNSQEKLVKVENHTSWVTKLNTLQKYIVDEIPLPRSRFVCINKDYFRISPWAKSELKKTPNRSLPNKTKRSA